MPIVHRVVQGSPEWLALRAGIPTASEFDKILTPSGKPSASAEKYLFGLLAERMMGHSRIEAVSTWMQRGNEMEAEAVAFYEAQRDLETVPVGFVTNEAGTIGASPDRLVGNDGLLEIKVPSEAVHVSYLLKKSVDQAYYPQVQGQLWITERKWADILSYHPEMPPALIRVERDEAFIALLAEAVGHFSVLLEEYSADLLKRGWIKPKEAPTSPQAEFLSQEDVDYTKSLAAPPQADPAPIAPIVGEAPPPPPATKKRLPKRKTNEELAADMGLFMKAAKLWKGRLLDVDNSVNANERYYGVLGALGVEHANGLRTSTERLRALEGWSQKLVDSKSSGPVPPPAAFTPQAGPAPGSAPPSMEQEAPPAELFPETPPPAPPAEDEWTRAMRHLYREEPRRFLDKIAEWGLSKFEDIPQAERQGRLEVMRVWLR